MILLNKHILSAIVAVFATLFSAEAIACSCMSRGAFVDYTKQSQGVIRAKIVAYGDKLLHGDTLYESMSVDVISVVKGALNFESIVLLGDPGHLCRDYVDSKRLVIGREYLIALHSDENVQPFGGCGEAWLRIDGDTAKGYKWVGDEYQEYAQPLSSLLEKLNQT